MIEFDLNSLTAPGTLNTLRRIWTDPQSFDTGVTVEKLTEEAANRFSKIALGLHQRGEDPAATAHFIMQMVFCLFAEDIKLLPNRIFSEMVKADKRAPELFRQDAQTLLEAMHTGGRVYWKTIPHVNGGLFATVRVPSLKVEEIGLLKEAADLDWSSIEPAIFGTLFERSLDPAKRSQLGAHYTGRGDIERVVEPVVMVPLRRRWEHVRQEATVLLKEIANAETERRQAGTSGEQEAATRVRNTTRAAFDKLLRDFLTELRSASWAWRQVAATSSTSC